MKLQSTDDAVTKTGSDIERTRALDNNQIVTLPAPGEFLNQNL